MSKRKQEHHPNRNFFLRRFFRIAPMYYLGVAFYTFWFTCVQVRPVSTANMLANLTFLHGINPYWINSLVPGGWSITVEMWFYCVAPFLFSKLKTVDQGVRFLAYGIFANCILSIFLTPLHILPDHGRWLAFLFLYFPNQLPVFGFGILLFLLLHSKQPKVVSSTTRLLAVGAVLAVLMTGFGNDNQHYFGLSEGGKHYWFAAVFMVLAFALSKHAPRLLVNPLVNYIGEISFSLYLVHFAVLFTLEYTGHSALILADSRISVLLDFCLRYALVVAVSITIATVFYCLVEMPCQNLGKRLIGHLEQ